MDSSLRPGLPGGPPAHGSAAVTGPAARDHRAEEDAGPWYRRINWSASFWVVFLLFLLGMIVGSDASDSVRATTAGAVVVFILLYVYTVSTMPSWDLLPPETSPVRQVRPLLRYLALLALPAALCLPFLGWWCVYLLPYFSAVLLFGTRLATGLSIVTTLCAGSVLAAVASPEPLETKWLVAGCSLSCLVVVVARIGDETSERRRTADRELTAAREREEISRDVHDVLGHSLTVLTLKAEVAQRLVEVDPAAAQAELDEIVALSRTALADVRATVTRLRTPDLASQLEASRTAFAAAEIEAEVHGRARDIPLPQREVLSWALREATTNVLRHAGARRVVVTLAPGRLTVADDGAGLRGHGPGNGLAGLRERVEAVGGQLRVAGPGLAGGTGEGTTVEVTL
ncbi:MAG: sensor histidine kinase [Actinomyces urogenitalis]|uniref:sensor histidine kinase n=1 Tax=Actinomyces urogenitalis TaxID=103621 RepID=UPI002A80F7E2|nr:sensor histidine kinase [Actinomyces urogenitalis]MDY3679420.1 sensor histidine kinase [Actinomyces urogenitalis]